MDRYVNGQEIVEIVFRPIAYVGECLGVCSVPTGVTVEEALRLLREKRRNAQQQGKSGMVGKLVNGARNRCAYRAGRKQTN